VVTPPFRDVVTDPAGLEALFRAPGKLVANKKTDRVAGPTAAFIAACPFVLVATGGRDGHVTVSPKGGPPGFVKVLDERRLIVPDANGNNLIDGLRNLVENPHIGLLFVLPGREETLRIDGRAWPTVDPEVLDAVTEDEGRRPKVAIGVEVTATFIHCSRSFARGRVWQPESWGELVAPGALDVFRCHLADNLSADELPEAGRTG
jgi:PPOX class probable FMN-dependent enzyme